MDSRTDSPPHVQGQHGEEQHLKRKRNDSMPLSDDLPAPPHYEESNQSEALPTTEEEIALDTVQKTKSELDYRELAHVIDNWADRADMFRRCYLIADQQLTQLHKGIRQAMLELFHELPTAFKKQDVAKYLKAQEEFKAVFDERIEEMHFFRKIIEDIMMDHNKNATH